MVRTTRLLLGLTQAELASKLGYSVKQVQRWETGRIKPRSLVLERMRQLRNDRPSSRNYSFTFVDLFAGIGGMRIGFEAAGGKCVFTSEYDRHCQRTYADNFEVGHAFAGDIRSVDERDIPPHDVLLAGFPCQPFSIAGVSKKNALGRPHGFECNTQGTLFFEIQRILAYHRPAAFLLENVKNLTRHDGGRTFSVILDVLEKDLGYHVFTKVIDARAFVPQHRERIYMVGFREPTRFSWDIFLKGGAEPVLGSILHPEDGSEEAEPPFTEGDLATVGEKYTLSNKLWTYLQQYAEKHRQKGNGFGYGLFTAGDVARTLSARYYKDGSEILIARTGRNPRRLTPRECARLMGFDSSQGSRFRIPVSDTQAYKQFGNSVAVPVVEAIASAMVGTLQLEDQLSLPSMLG